MGALAIAILTGILLLFKNLLPVSPFADLALPAAMDTGLGWLNWIFPIGDMLGIFSIWLLAAATWAIVTALIRIARRSGTALTVS